MTVYTLESVAGSSFGVTRERIRQIENARRVPVLNPCVTEGYGLSPSTKPSLSRFCWLKTVWFSNGSPVLFAHY